MIIKTSRRSLIRGLGAIFIAAPAIVRVASIMPVKSTPTVSMANLIEYDVGAGDDMSVDVLYGYCFPRGEWRLLDMELTTRENIKGLLTFNPNNYVLELK